MAFIKNNYPFIIFVGLLSILFGISCIFDSKEVDLGANDYKLMVSDEGIYKVSLSNIGWNDVDQTNISLKYNGKENSFFYVYDKNKKYVMFYFNGLDNAYDQYTALQLNNKGRYSNNNVTYSQEFYPNHKMRNDVSVNELIEDNNIYLPKVSRGDHWLMDKFISPAKNIYGFNAKGVSDGSGSIELSLWGITKASTNPDHHIQVSINGTIVGQIYWDGITRETSTLDILPGIIHNGDNKIEVESNAATGSLVDIVYLDWISVNYHRFFSSISSQTKFYLIDNNLQINTSEPMTIFQISNSGHNTNITKTDIHGDTTFSGSINDTYYAVPDNDYLSPLKVIPLSPGTNLRNPDLSFDYIIIGDPSLLKGIQPLADLRREQGIKVLILDSNLVFDQFNYGNKAPQGITNFLRYASYEWISPPKYVLLVGDATYDPKGYKNNVLDSFLPTFFIQTKYGGETGSDVPMAMLDNDLFPDIAIGRLPASNSKQVKNYVNKVVRYEKMLDDAPNQIVAIADPQSASFTYDATEFLNHFPSQQDKQLIAKGSLVNSINNAILDAFDTGAALMSYFGHGSIDTWGKDNLFTSEQADNLNNSFTPIVLNMTCLTGYFINPNNVSIAEKLILNPHGGAIAVIAPSSLTLPDNQQYFCNAFADNFINNSGSKIGDVILYAWNHIPADSDIYEDVLKTYMLFGDPTVTIPMRMIHK